MHSKQRRQPRPRSGPRHKGTAPPRAKGKAAAHTSAGRVALGERLRGRFPFALKTKRRGPGGNQAATKAQSPGNQATANSPAPVTATPTQQRGQHRARASRGAAYPGRSATAPQPAPPATGDRNRQQATGPGPRPPTTRNASATRSRTTSVALAASTWAHRPTTATGRPRHGARARQAQGQGNPPGTPAAARPAPPGRATQHRPTRWGDCTKLCSRAHSYRIARTQPQASAGHAGKRASAPRQPSPAQQTPTSATPTLHPSWCLFVPCMNREARHKTEQKV